MPSLTAARAANAQYNPAHVPVAVFVGGTSGIGEGIARALVRHTQGNVRVVIVGRNRAAAEAIFASFPTSTPAAEPAPQHEFVECDVTRMKNVKTATDALGARLAKVNFLVMTTGSMSMGGREETEEGIDRKFAVHYYGRWKLIDGLMPLLRKAKDAGEDAKVMSVLAAGKGINIDLNDLGLKKSYGVVKSVIVPPTYTDLMIESFAEREPDISFIHTFPGNVHTPLAKGQKFDWLLRLLYPIIRFRMYFFGLSPDDSGEYMLYALLGAKKGASRIGSRGDDIGRARLFTSDEARKRLWEHTVAATSV